MDRVNRRIKQGTVIKANQSKTVVVHVRRWTHHPLYGKALRRLKKYYAHDANDKCSLGDLVQIEESRPLSKLKRWKVVEILQHKDVPDITPLELDMQDDTSISPGQQGEAEATSTDNGQQGETEATSTDNGQQGEAEATSTDNGQQGEAEATSTDNGQEIELSEDIHEPAQDDGGNGEKP